MSELIVWTYDWAPEGPRGFVRDLRLRWACEEAGLAYSVRTVPFDGRETNHLSRQPFGQVLRVLCYLRSQELEGAARTLGLQIHPVSLESPSVPALERGFGEAARAGALGLVVVPDAMLIALDNTIARSALAARLAAIGENRTFAESGGLLTYGPSYPDLLRRSVGYVDRILKGARPGDLPVEQPTRFELTVNARTAKALGLTVPPTLLLRADRVIE